MTTAGPFAPTTADQYPDPSGSAGAWASGSGTADSILSSDDEYVSSALLESDHFFTGVNKSDFLRLGGFDFSSVPSSATIEGVTIEIEAVRASGASDIKFAAYSGIGSSGHLATYSNSEAASDTEAFVTCGGPTDNGGYAYTGADIKDPDFFIDLQAFVSASGTESGTVDADSARVTIDFTDGTVLAGTFTIDGTSSVSAAGARVKCGAASVAGTTSCSASGASTRTGTAAIAGTATLAASAASTGAGTASITGAGTLAAAAAIVLGGAAAIAAAASLAAAGASIAGGTASLAGTVTLAVSAASIAAGTAGIAGTGSLAAAGARVVAGTSAIAGTATLAAASAAVAAGAVTIAGSAAVAAAGGSTVLGSATMAGTSLVLAAGAVHFDTPSWRTVRPTITSRRVNAGGAIRTVDAGRSA